MLAEIARCIKSANQVTVLSHQAPDGDAIGSSLGLGLALEKMGKSVQVACPDPVPEKYRFLPSSARIVTELSRSPELAVVVDTDGWGRLGALQTAVQTAQTTILIDHHYTNSGGADLDYLDPSLAACAQQIYYLLPALAVELDAQIATCLYCGLGTDSGFFTFQNTLAPALRVAAALVAAGADAHQIARRTSEQLSVPAAILRGRALTSIQTAAGGRLVYATLTARDFAAAGATAEDTEGTIDLLKSIVGAEVVALFRADGNGHCRVSLRSENLDVAGIAAQFGGGGHRPAAGLEMAGSAPAVRAKVVKALQQALDEEP